MLFAVNFCLTIYLLTLLYSQDKDLNKIKNIINVMLIFAIIIETLLLFVFKPKSAIIFPSGLIFVSILYIYINSKNTIDNTVKGLTITILIIYSISILFILGVITTVSTFKKLHVKNPDDSLRGSIFKNTLNEVKTTK
jgi:asparagine N-glycosylation enzyme membrane subunit Stt3